MAVITSIYLGLLIYKLFNVTKNNFLRSLAVSLALLLVTQISLGALNVLWVLPLPIAMAHNAVAALLLLIIITLNIDYFFSNTTINLVAKMCGNKSKVFSIFLIKGKLFNG